MMRIKQTAHTSTPDPEHEIRMSNVELKKQKKNEVPKKELLTGLGLLLFGILCIGVGVGLYFELLDVHPDYADRTWPLIILGVITILPGSYVASIAVDVWMGRPGASWAELF